ncbi:MAG: hypothetical protein ACLFPI_01170 [Desulfobacterales bacterium]
MSKEKNVAYDFDILPEKAADTDVFVHKTHERVAATLSKLILKEGSKGQTIGLEGTWGNLSIICFGKQKIINRGNC